MRATPKVRFSGHSAPPAHLAIISQNLCTLYMSPFHIHIFIAFAYKWLQLFFFFFPLFTLATYHIHNIASVAGANYTYYTRLNGGPLVFSFKGDSFPILELEIRLVTDERTNLNVSTSRHSVDAVLKYNPPFVPQTLAIRNSVDTNATFYEYFIAELFRPKSA